MTAVTSHLSSAVLAAMEAAAQAEILPRWRSLREDEIRTKAGEWDLVTDADVLAEQRLTRSLRGLLDVPVVGEEATAADASLMDVAATAPAYWLVDPVDGTRNFVHGKEDFACMVALVEDGRTVGAWITHPVVGRRIWAARGEGTFIDGVRVSAPEPSSLTTPSGAIGARMFMEDPESVHRRAAQLGPVRDIRFCAGWDYYDVLMGAKDYVLFSRSLPWDHAPGGLLCEEAGLRVARFDGSEYLPGESRQGLLTAHPSIWEHVRDALGLE